MRDNLHMKSIVVTPTYNESENIESFIEDVLRQDPGLHIVIVDDHSPDGTGALVRNIAGNNHRVHLIDRQGPRGRGYADCKGMEFAIQERFDYIFQMDADFSHLPRHIPDFLKAMETCDVAVGSRLIPGGGIKGRGWMRNLTTVLANAYIRVVLGLKIKDCTTGYRCYRREALSALNFKNFISPGPSLLEEILYACYRRGFRIREIPIVFYDRQKGRSKLGIRELLRMLVYIVLFRIKKV